MMQKKYLKSLMFKLFTNVYEKKNTDFANLARNILVNDKTFVCILHNEISIYESNIIIT